MERRQCTRCGLAFGADGDTWRCAGCRSRRKPPSDPVARAKARCTEHPASGCWIWNGGTSVQGKPIFHHAGRRVYVTRCVWEQVRGPLEAGTTLIRTCAGGKLCVAPYHHEPAGEVLRTCPSCGRGFAARHTTQVRCRAWCRDRNVQAGI